MANRAFGKRAQRNYPHDFAGELGMEELGTENLAVTRYQQAWSLLPEPPAQWDLAQWIASCLADAFFEQAQYAESKAWAMIAVDTKPSRETSSWVVYAKACIESGETDLAVEYLGKAYALGKSGPSRASTRSTWPSTWNGNRADCGGSRFVIAAKSALFELLFNPRSSLDTRCR